MENFTGYRFISIAFYCALICSVINSSSLLG
nr:MAG TPA: hypothetical protein [Caudoviricetes sp.]